MLCHLDIELTERCNNNCIHCYINRPADDIPSKNEEMATAEVKRILEEAVALGCISVRFTGGEPLLREDFQDIYVFARKQGLRVLIFTNACLITESLATLFSRIPPLEDIEVSVYGMQQNSYESVTRSPGSFDKARRGINLLLQMKVPFVVKAALLPSFRHEIKEFEEWAHKNTNIPGEKKYDNYSMSFDLRARRDSKEKNRQIKKLRLSPEERLGIIAQNRDEYVKAIRKFCSQFIGIPGKRLFSCGAGVQEGCVDAYGNLQLCMLLRHPDTVYKLREGPLKDALQIFFPEIRKMEASCPEYIERCARCFIKGLLCEQCPAKSWMEHGVLDMPVEYLCEVAHAKARFLELLGEDENSWEVDGRERIKDFLERTKDFPK